MSSTSNLQSYRVLNQPTLQPLHQLLPMKVPYALHIDPANVCNFRCHFCPTGDYQLLQTVSRPKGLMDLSLFQKIIDDLNLLVQETGQWVTRLYLYKDGEPLLNPHLPEMIAYARQANVASSIETTTNGSLLTQTKAMALMTAGLDVIRISVEHVSDQGYQEITQTFSNYQQIKDQVAQLYRLKQEQNSSLKIYVKILDVCLTDPQKQTFLQDFAPISDFINIDSLTGLTRTDMKDFRLGTTPTTGVDSVTQRQEKRMVCPDAFTKLAINFDGTVSVCCQDWSHGTLVGDLRRESLSTVWRGSALQAFRQMHLNGHRFHHPVCSTCDHIYGFPDFMDLDDHCQGLVDLYPESV